MSWKGRNAEKWNYWPKTPKKQGRQNQQGTGRGRQAKGTEIPGYDASQYSSAPSAPSSASQGESDLKKAMQSLVDANKLHIPDEMKALLEIDGMQAVKQEQQALNRKKKLVLKLERLKLAKTSKTQALARYKEDILKKLRSEQDRYEKEMEELEQSIQQTQLELDKMENGMSEDESEEDLDKILQDPEKLKMAQELEDERKRNQQAQNQLLVLKEQIKTYQANAGNVPFPEETATPDNAAIKEAQKEEEEARRRRRERIKKVDNAFKDADARERSPRRESQDSSHDINELGWKMSAE